MSPKDEGQVAYEAWCYAYSHKAPPGGFTPWRDLEVDMRKALAEQEATCRELERAAVVKYTLKHSAARGCVLLASDIEAGKHREEE